MTGPTIVTSGIAAQKSALWVYSRKCVLSTWWNDLSKTVVLVRFGLVFHTSRCPEQGSSSHPRVVHHQIHRWTFTGTRFLSSLWHGTLLPDRILLNWLQENIEKRIIWNKRRRWSHSSRVKFSLVNMSASCFFGVHIFDLDLWFWIDSVEKPMKSNFVGSGHLSHCWTSSFYDHLDDCFVVFKNLPLRLAFRRMCVCGYEVHIWQLINIKVALFSWCFYLGFIARVVSCPAPVSWNKSNWSFGVVCTSINPSQWSRASRQSIRSPASNEMISDAVELWDTDVCFLHIQPMETNVRLPKKHKTLMEVDFAFSKSTMLCRVTQWQYCR